MQFEAVTAPTVMRVEAVGTPTISLRVWGSGTNACLLVHGFGDGGFVWEKLAQRLAPDRKVLAVDLRGHGDSEWALDARYDVTAHAEDLQRVIQATAVDHFVIVGHSMGAALALRLATMFPARVRGVVVADHSPVRNPDAFTQIREGFRSEHRIYVSVEDYAKWLGERRPLVNSDLLRHIAEASLRRRTTGFELKRDPAMISDFEKWDASKADAWILLEKLELPVLVVRGAASAVLSRQHAEAMVSILARGRLAEVSRAGHGLMLDNPGGFVGAVRPFIDEMLINDNAD